MDFSDWELSLDISGSAESLVDFVAEIPGLDWEDKKLTIILSDWEKGLPKLKKQLTE